MINLILSVAMSVAVQSDSPLPSDTFGCLQLEDLRKVSESTDKAETRELTLSMIREKKCRRFKQGTLYTPTGETEYSYSLIQTYRGKFWVEGL